MIIPIQERGRTPDEVLEAPGRRCNLRGGVFQARIAWVLERAGQTGLRALWQRLSSDLRGRAPESIDSSAWMPFHWLVDLDGTIAEVFGGGRSEMLYDLGRYSARLNFGQKLGLSLGLSVQSHFWDARTHHDLFQDYGSCTYVPLHEQAFRLDYSGYVVRSRVFCRTGLGYFEASVRLLGGRDPIVEETACHCFGDATCSYVVTWER